MNFSTKNNLCFLKVMLLGLFLSISICTVTLAASYTVKPGDSLFLIGQKFGVTVGQIQSANGIKGTAIYPGQTLIITEKYTVKKGDTLYLIASKYGTTSQQLMNYNGLKNTYLYPGQVLVIPQNTTTVDRRSAAGTARSISRSSIAREDYTLLARTVYSEARGEPYKGQVAVASVVLNRLEHKNFPNTIRGVIFEPLAFSAVADGQFWLNPDQTAYNAVNEALDGWDPANGAIYYWNPKTATSKWIWSRTITDQIGQHVFGF